jgi:D-tyrosyl-tRNA(Tyr) deacylase
MRAIIQRVSQANVDIPEQGYRAEIALGYLILLGIETDDQEQDLLWLAKKICALRIFSDPEGKMNLSITDVQGQILLISQFTLHASTKKGKRPSFIKAARPEQAIPLYEKFAETLRADDILVETGIFGADMKVNLTNDGPVTIMIDSKNRE